jgi:hypothetical protein
MSQSSYELRHWIRWVACDGTARAVNRAWKEVEPEDSRLRSFREHAGSVGTWRFRVLLGVFPEANALWRNSKERNSPSLELSALGLGLF